jgi:hypothetical protein
VLTTFSINANTTMLLAETADGGTKAVAVFWNTPKADLDAAIADGSLVVADQSAQDAPGGNLDGGLEAGSGGLSDGETDDDFGSPDFGDPHMFDPFHAFGEGEGSFLEPGSARSSSTRCFSRMTPLDRADRERARSTRFQRDR